MCVFSVQHGKSYFLLLELESEALPARVALPADKKNSLRMDRTDMRIFEWQFKKCKRRYENTLVTV